MDCKDPFLKILLCNASNIMEEDDFFSGILKGELSLKYFEDDLMKIGIKFSQTNCSLSKKRKKIATSKRIFFEFYTKHIIPFLGHPFTMDGSIYKVCHLGGVERVKEQHPRGDHDDYQQPQSNPVRGTKKTGCEATFIIKKLQVYEGIKVESTHLIEKEAAIKQVATGNYTTACWFFFKITKPHLHNHGHGEVTQLSLTIHPELVEKVKDLVREGITKVCNVKIILTRYVMDYLLKDSPVLPSSYNAGFFPSTKAIENAIRRAVQSEKYSKIDEQELVNLVKEWKEDCVVFHRPFRKISSSEITIESNSDEQDNPSHYVENFLLVHQTVWQQGMLKRYGKMCLINASYKMTQYSLPLFFLVVKTNVGYIVVATFITQYGTQHSISEALLVIREWNPEWHPQYFMSDRSEVEINAIGDAFPEATTFICDFHREQAWLSWLRKSGNVSGNYEDLLAMWRKLAACSTLDEYNSEVAEMESSEIWQKNPKAQKYFESHWIRLWEKWVRLHRSYDVECNINTNNGIELQNRVLKNNFLASHNDKTVSGIMNVIVNDYLVESYKNYVHRNAKLSSAFGRYRSHIPLWLHNRPNKFVKHVTTRITLAKQEFDLHSIRQSMEANVFEVTSVLDSFSVVNMNEPSCTCHDFRKWFYPCKHICAILVFISNSFLPSHYLDSPYLTIDYKVVKNLSRIAATDSEELGNENELTSEDEMSDLLMPSSPSHQRPFLAERTAELRGVLQSISDLTFLMLDPGKVEYLLAQLKAVQKYASESVTEDNSGLRDTSIQSSGTGKIKDMKRSAAHMDLLKNRKRKTVC